LLSSENAPCCSIVCCTELPALLSAIALRRVLIAGWATDFCVDATVRSAVSRGHAVVVVGDAHTVGDRPHLDAASVIRHHNWIWANLISEHPIRVAGTAELLDEAARDLAELALALIRRFRWRRRRVPVVTAGGVFQASRRVRQGFERRVRQRAPLAEFTLLRRPAVEGALMLARKLAQA